MGLESEILSDLRQLLDEHGVKARWQGIDLLVLVSRVDTKQQIDMGGFVESPDLSLRVPKAAFPDTLPEVRRAHRGGRHGIPHLAGVRPSALAASNTQPIHHR